MLALLVFGIVGRESLSSKSDIDQSQISPPITVFIPSIDTVHKIRRSRNAVVILVSPKIGGIKLSNGEVQKADGQLAGSPSQLFDAVAIVLSTESVKKLTSESAAIQWVVDAFVHLKAIGYSDAAKSLLDKANVVMDDGIQKLDGTFVEAATQRYWDRESKVRSLT